MSPNLRGVFYSLMSFGIFATHDVAVKTLGGHYSPVQIIFFSVLLGFPLVTLLLITDRSDGNLRPKHPWWSTLRTLCAVVTGLSAFYAFSALPLAQTYAILFAAPLLITLLAIPILGERVGLRRGTAVLVGMIGVLIVLRPSVQPLELGHLAALASAVFWALSSVIARKIGSDERPAVLILYPMLANFVVLGIALPFVYKPMPIEDMGLIAVIASFGFVATLFIIAAYRNAEAVIVASMQYSQMLWAIFYGFLFFSEWPDNFTLVGAGVIMASGVYIVMREASAKTSDLQPVLASRARPDTGTMVKSSLFGLIKPSQKKLP